MITGSWCWGLFQLAGYTLGWATGSPPGTCLSIRSLTQVSPASHQHTFHLCLQAGLEPNLSDSQPSTLQTAISATESYDLLMLSLESLHQDEPLLSKSPACVDAHALITDLKTPRNLPRCLPSAVRRRAEVCVGPNELLAPSQEFYEVPEVHPGVGSRSGVIYNPLTLDDCWLLASFPWLPSEIKAPFTRKERHAGGLETIFIASPDRFRHLRQFFACNPISCVILLHSKASVATPACHFLVWIYLEMIRKK